MLLNHGSLDIDGQNLGVKLKISIQAINSRKDVTAYLQLAGEGIEQNGKEYNRSSVVQRRGIILHAVIHATKEQGDNRVEKQIRDCECRIRFQAYISSPQRQPHLLMIRDGVRGPKPLTLRLLRPPRVVELFQPFLGRVLLFVCVELVYQPTSVLTLTPSSGKLVGASRDPVFKPRLWVSLAWACHGGQEVWRRLSIGA